MACKICGDEKNVRWRNRSQMFLCGFCNEGTPRKVGRATFLKAYFPEGIDDRTGRDFYDDYKCSEYTLQEYINATVSATM